MGSIKDIVDLITQLRNSIQDRKIVSELLQIQSYVDFLHSEWLQTKERALEYKTENAQLKEDIIELKRQIRRLEDSYAKEIRDLRMIHRVEMAGTDDAHELRLKELEESHAREIAALMTKLEDLERRRRPADRQDDGPLPDRGAD